MWLLRKKAVKLVESIKNRWTSERGGHVIGKTATSTECLLSGCVTC